MNISYSHDLGLGIDRLVPLLTEQPILYGQLLGILLRIKRQPELFGQGKPHLWLVESEEGDLIGGACRTPPYPLQFSLMKDDVLRNLARRVLKDDPHCPSVIGPTPQVEILAHTLESRGAPAEVRLDMTLYGLTTLRMKPKGELTLRKAEGADFDLVSKWLHQFAIDCNLPDGPMASERIRRELDEGRIDLGINRAGKPVLMFKAILLGETRTLRVGAVYTPDEERGKGYASEGLAQVVNNLLGTHVDAVTLFADKGNPISNRMYLKLGFEQHADIRMMTWADRR